MANKKVIELQEALDESNFYIIGTVDGDKISKKFNLGTLNNKINTINSLNGDLEEFDSNKNYFCGEYVIYNSKVYRFTKDHILSPWSNEDSEEILIFNKFNNIYNSTNNESVNVNIHFNDGNTILYENLDITVIYNDNQEIIQYDSIGNYSFNIPKGLEYTIKFPQIPGYFPVEDLVFESKLDERIIDIVYYSNLGSLKINFIVYNEDYDRPLSEYDNISDNEKHPLDGLSVNLGDNNRPIVNSTVIFDNLIAGNEYSIILPDGESVGYRKPPIKDSITVYNNTEINVIYKPYKEPGAYLIYTIETEEDNLEYREVKISELFNETDEWIGPDEIDINNSIAIHVYPAKDEDLVKPTLSNKISIEGWLKKVYYFDYIVKIQDLVTISPNKIVDENPEGLIPFLYSYNQDVNILDLTTFVNGLYNSYYMKMLYRHCCGREITNSCILLNSGLMEYKGKNLHEFTGSVLQTFFLCNRFYDSNNSIGTGRKNYQDIIKILNHFGYNTDNYTLDDGTIRWSGSNFKIPAANSNYNIFPQFRPHEYDTSGVNYSANTSYGYIALPFYAPYEYIPNIN